MGEWPGSGVAKGGNMDVVRERRKRGWLLSTQRRRDAEKLAKMSHFRDTTTPLPWHSSLADENDKHTILITKLNFGCP